MHRVRTQNRLITSGTSLVSSICPVVKQYKKDLKAAVEQALAAGTITCPRPGEPTYPIRRIESEFPELSHHHQEKMSSILKEWFSNSTLNKVLSDWEQRSCPITSQFTPLNILTYNVQGWGTRALEVMDLIFKVDSFICVFTE
ncbi:unnamed protein product, partial [Rotaria sp. Silwood2]